MRERAVAALRVRLREWGPLSREQLREQLATFDAARAQCALEQDRERLLAVIEAGFGAAGRFNAIVRGVLDGGVWAEPSEEAHLGHQLAAVVPTTTSRTPSGSSPSPTGSTSEETPHASSSPGCTPSPAGSSC